MSASLIRKKRIDFDIRLGEESGIPLAPRIEQRPDAGVRRPAVSPAGHEVHGVVVVDRVQDLTGLLRCGGRVEVGKGLSVSLRLEDREVLTDLLDVEGLGAGALAMVTRSV